MPNQSLTIVDLAVETGLSKTTVADALRGSGRVSEQTRHRVQEAASKLGYVSNRAARQLRTSASTSLGLYISPDVRNMSFYMPFAFGAADEAARLNYDLTLVARQTTAAESWNHLGGAVVVDVLPEDPVAVSLIQSKVPVISAGRLSGPESSAVRGVVEIDHKRMCAELLDCLARNGATRPALLAPASRDTYSWARQIRQGYTEWCNRRNLQPIIETLDSFPDAKALEGALLRPLDEECDAFLFGWQDLAERAELVLGTAGYQIGSDIHFGSFSNRSDGTQYGKYAATLDLRPREFGAASIRMLSEIVANPDGPTRFERHDAVLHTNDAGH